MRMPHTLLKGEKRGGSQISASVRSCPPARASVKNYELVQNVSVLGC